MSLSVGDRVGRYEILGPLAAGGMGEVFRACDTELERVVAVKVLPEAVAEDPTRLERFRREARVLATLSHPNLLEIYDSGSSNGLHYAVTELLEGDTLRRRIPVSGLPWRRVAEIGAAVADGLAAAHARGIVHRDLKPENLFVTSDGRVKILDFGLAKVVEEPDSEGEAVTVTDVGTVMGTPAYMAPEQVTGHPADQRSDIFSLGCVLYEMVSGRRAFSGDTGVEVMAAILKEEPPQLSSSGATVPLDLERTVHRCLEKRPEARFQSAADLAYSLQHIGSSQATPVMAAPTPTATTAASGARWRWRQVAIASALAIVAAVISWQALTPKGEQTPVGALGELNPKRIAVVPFVNRTGDAALDGLAARTTDRLTQGLADLQEIEVAPASAVSAAPADVNPAKVVREVAQRTNSGLVLTGVWDTVGDGFELQGTLEDAQAGTIVRAFDPIQATRESPEEAIANLRDWTLMAVQDHLHPLLAWGAGDRFPKYEAYLSNRRYFEEFSAGNPTEARIHRARAIELDPLFARPLIQLGSTWLPDLVPELHHTLIPIYASVHEMRLTPTQQRLTQMIDARLAGRWDDAFRLASEELERDPSDFYQQAMVAFDAVRTNRAALAIDTFRRLEWDPLTPNAFRFALANNVSRALHVAGRHDDELTLARQLVTQGQVQTLGGSAWAVELRALAALGRMKEIESTLGEVFLEPQTHTHDAAEALQVAAELRAHGFRDEAHSLVERTVERLETEAAASAAPQCVWCWTGALIAAGRLEEGCPIVDDLLAEAPENRDLLATAGVCAARRGDTDRARELEAHLQALGDAVGPSGVPPVRGITELRRAMIAAQLGEHERAIVLLQQAVSAGYCFYAEIHAEPAFEPLWDDPEFQRVWQPKG